MNAAEFLNERRDFLYVYTVPSVSGDGWDVVVRIDGTYSEPEMADAAAEELWRVLRSLSDLQQDGRDWWAGPPFPVKR